LIIIELGGMLGKSFSGEGVVKLKSPALPKTLSSSLMRKLEEFWFCDEEHGIGIGLGLLGLVLDPRGELGMLLCLGSA